MIKELIKIAGDVFLVIFITTLLGAAVFMIFKKENTAEQMGNIAYLSLLLAALTKAVYHKIFI